MPSDKFLKDLKKYEFRKILEELKERRGKGTELISVYIPPDRQISDVMSHLREEHGQASNIKSKSTRTNVQSALESILSRLRYLEVPENGLAIFCGAIDVGGGRSSLETYIVEPPEKIKSYIYHCDSSFLLEPLERMLEERDKFGLIVLDKKEATIGMLHGKLVEPLRHLTSNVPGKQRKGGQSAPRFQRLREIAVEEFYQRIGRHANELFLPEKDELKGILIGGPSPTKEEFIKGEYLHYELQRKIIGAFDVAYTDESGLFELMDKAEDALAELDLIKEKRLMTKFLRLLANDEGLVAYSEAEVRKMLEIGAVETLLLSEGLPHDKVMELSELAEAAGTNVELISKDFEEGLQLLKAFGGIAAVLRYRANKR